MYKFKKTQECTKFQNAVFLNFCLRSYVLQSRSLSQNVEGRAAKLVSFFTKRRLRRRRSRGEVGEPWFHTTGNTEESTAGSTPDSRATALPGGMCEAIE